MGTKMGPSYANFFEVLSNTNFLVSTTAPNLNSTVATLMIASALPPLPPLIPFARLLNILLDTKIQLKATVYALVFTTNIQIHIVTCCIHLRAHHTQEFHTFFTVSQTSSPMYRRL